MLRGGGGSQTKKKSSVEGVSMNIFWNIDQHIEYYYLLFHASNLGRYLLASPQL